MSENHIQQLKATLQPELERLRSHQLYHSISTMRCVRTYMQHHVFAVWDFMSLLKCLQHELTCTQIPWLPKGDPAIRYMINEIVIGEESDSDPDGGHTSHFELYLRGMKQCGADCESIGAFIALIQSGVSVREALMKSGAPDACRDFVNHTFAIIHEGALHKIAAAFAFGREDVIPTMFREVVSGLNTNHDDQLSIFKYYLERHIELDGDEHGELAMRMVQNICGSNEVLWNEAATAAVQCLQMRLRLWDAILHVNSIESNPVNLADTLNK